MEAWKNTSLEYLLDTPLVAPLTPDTPVPAGQPLSGLTSSLGNVYRLGFVDAIYSEALSSIAHVPPEAVLADLTAQLRSQPERWRSYFEKRGTDAGGPFAAINLLGFRGGALLYLPENCKLRMPVHLLFSQSGQWKAPALLCGRILIILGKSSELTVVSTHEGAAGHESLPDWTADVFLGENSRLRWMDVRRDTGAAYGIMNLNGRLESGAALNMTVFSGGHVRARCQTDLVFAGEGGSAALEGLAFLSGNAERSDVLHVFHRASRCVTRQVYKNILAGSARAEYNSLVHVERGTAGSDAEQLNRNLVLSDNARACSRPQLKIDSDDVKASHGSATGQLQEEEIFYLRSRGLSPEEAEFALTYGFAREILFRIELQGLRNYLDAWLRESLQRMAARPKIKGGAHD
jgi:Fe-S cluster assembly protein SufD